MRWYDMNIIYFKAKFKKEIYKIFSFLKFDRAFWNSRSDWTPEHKYKALCGTRLNKARVKRDVTPQQPSFLKICKSWNEKIPVEFNRCNFPNPIRDQMGKVFRLWNFLKQSNFFSDCGFCWAFSTIQVLEGLIYQCLGKRTELSVQQLVDCDSYNEACDGGWPSELKNTF